VHTVILDTDIGSDVDDALALAILLGSDSINLLGITTVYGDTKLRAQIALHLCSLAGREIPTFAGESAPISGREVWLSGSEGEGIQTLDQYKVETDSGTHFLVNTINSRPKQVDLLAIGPLTNIAKAIEISTDFSKNIKNLWIMGGDFSRSKVEHNFKCDVNAAKIVLESKIPITILDLPSSQKTIIERAEINRIQNSGKLGPFLYSEIMKWIQPRRQDWTTPHDPIAILGCLRPELFEISKQGKVEIKIDGISEWSEDPVGNVRLISPKEPKIAIEEMIYLLSRLC